MAYQTVFFDWGGVLADDPGDGFLGELLLNVGASQKQVEEIFETYMKDFMRGKLTEGQYWHALRQNYGLSIHDTISEEFRHWKGLDANQDILGLVQEVRSAGLTAAALTNVIEPTFRVIEAAGYYTAFDHVIASCKAGYAKPDPEIYHIALRTVGAKPEEVIFIDDKQKCLDPAAADGWTTVLATSPAQIIHDVRQLLATQ